jgi:hypothetical protein
VKGNYKTLHNRTVQESERHLDELLDLSSGYRADEIVGTYYKRNPYSTVSKERLRSVLFRPIDRHEEDLYYDALGALLPLDGRSMEEAISDVVKDYYRALEDHYDCIYPIHGQLASVRFCKGSTGAICSAFGTESHTRAVLKQRYKKP